MIDYHIHALAHGEYDYTRDWLERFLAAARQKGIHQIGFAEHEELAARVNMSSLALAIGRKYPDLTVGIGLEMDYIPGREQDIRTLISGQAYDFIIGSIHYIDGWAFDHPDYCNGFEERDIDFLYARYYELVTRAINSRLFDILGHLDLIKIWGHRPALKSEVDFIQPFLQNLRDTGIVVEINSAGLRKPVKEIYPSEKLITALFNANIPITFGSDAHHPDDVGRDLDQARQAAWKAGYRVCTGFSKRSPLLTPIT